MTDRNKETKKICSVVAEQVFDIGFDIFSIASQGLTIEEATKNVKEAIDPYLEECPEKLDELAADSPPTFSFVEV